MKLITRIHVLSAVLFLFLSFLLSANSAFAETKTFIKEYTYQASDEDSKNSSRTISLREVKRLLLEELGTYLESETEVKNFKLSKDQITTLTAGIVQTELIEEKWNTENLKYWLKAKITADSSEVIKSIDTLRKDREKTKELEGVRKRSDDLLKENERLRKELATATGEKKQKDTAAYNETIKDLNAADWFEKGYASFISRNYNDSIGAYSKSIKLKPKDVDAYIMRGRAYVALHKYNLAIQDSDTAVKQIIHFPKYDPLELFAKWEAEAYVLRGTAYKGLRNFNQAIKDFNKAIELNPQDAFAYSHRGDTYYELGNYNQAVKDYNKVEEQNPYSLVSYRRGLAYSKLGNNNQAIDDFNDEISLDPKNAAAYYNRGLAYDKIGNHNKTINDLKIAARLDYKEAQDFLRKRGIVW